MSNLKITQFIEPTRESELRVQQNRRFQLPVAMLASSGTVSDLNKPDTVVERKWDGTRVMLVKEGSNVRFFTARGAHTEFTSKYPSVISDGKKLNCNSCILDGEFFFYDARGTDVFLTIAAKAEKIGSKKFKFVAFDILRYNGRDTRDMPYVDRKSLLDKVVPTSLTIIKENEFFETDKLRFYEEQLEAGAEGVIVKTKFGRYFPGRSDEWKKVKRFVTLDVIIKGATAGTGNRESTFGALKCYYPIGGELTYIGDVGTGFNNHDLAQIVDILRERKPFVIEVNFMKMTDDKKMRHPSFKRLRLDKTPEDVMRSQDVVL